MANKAKKVVIRILKSDIRKGEPGSTTSCPIARRLGIRYNTESVEVDGSDTLLAGDWMLTPATKRDRMKVARFISRFDDSKYVRPFKFAAYRESAY